MSARCKVRLNINTQLIITALKFTEFPDHVSKDYDLSIYLSIYLLIWGGGGQGGEVSSRNHKDHFSISRVTKNKISFSRFSESQKRITKSETI